MQTDRTPTTDPKPCRRRARPAGALVGVLAAAVVLLAACSGSSGSSSPTTAGPGSGSPGSSPSGGLLAYSKCMRSHGLTNFPDPNSQGVIEGKSSSASGGSGINPNSPTYQAAQKACQKYASGGTTPADQKQQLNQALKYSACMRSHGVTNFPDPTVVNGQIAFAGSGGVGRSPNFQSANTACQHYMASSGS